MKISYLYIYFITLLVIVVSCTTDIEAVKAVTGDGVLNVEEAKGVVILYSDSAELKVRISAAKMLIHTDKANPHDEFPDGIFVEFLGNNGKVYSWLEAESAVRYDSKNQVIARGNVRFYNQKQETLTSTELTWEEDKKRLWTNKFVRITQPMKGDTSYGYGFETNETFDQFEIKRRTSARFNIEAFKSSIEKN